MNTVNLETLERQYFGHLDNYAPVVVVDEAREALRQQASDEYDNAFDHFMHDYVGDPADSKKAPLALRGYENNDKVLSYPNRMYLGFTQSGKILLVRTTSEVELDSPEAFYIITADLQTSCVTPWYAIEVNERSNARTELDFAQTPNPQSEYDLGHLLISTQRVSLTLPGSRPERVPVLDDMFFTLLEQRNRFRQADAIGRVLTFMAMPQALSQAETAVTIAG